MSIGDSITLVSCLAGLMVALPGLMIFLNMLFSRTTERAVAHLTIGAKTAFFAGLIPLIVIGWVGLSLMAVGSIFQAIGTVTMLLLLAWLFTGLGVVARLIGLKLSRLGGRAENALSETLLGAFVLAFAIAFPLVGWFLVLPVSALVGGGAIVLGLINRRVNVSRPSFVPASATGD